MKEKCPKCDEYAGRGARFCGECGRDLTVNPMFNLGGRPLFTGCVIASVVSVILLLVEAVCLVLNTPAVFDLAGDWSYSLIMVTPKIVRLYVMTDYVLQAYWIAVVAILIACIVYALLRFYRDLSESHSKGTEAPLENSPFFWISVAFAASVFFSVVYALVIAAFGYSADASWMDDYTDRQKMFMLAEAPVWEEIITRVLLIGAPIAVLALIFAKPSDAPRCLLGGFGMSKTATVLIVLSALIFGLAHNEGWGMEKILPTFVVGVLLGYLYVRFGLYASILTHFLTDFMSAWQWLGLDALYVVFILILLALGLACFIYVLKEMKLRKIAALPLFAAFGGKNSE
ncbi:MAG: CPBP family intramembrane metalloprotease [Candidatus Methanoplasma sp.]|jgi:hypothetical protein|nr:CPBP family intramembrane metalloprotease [Candidatus Methanoplasma sp.]